MSSLFFFSSCSKSRERNFFLTFFAFILNFWLLLGIPILFFFFPLRLYSESPKSLSSSEQLEFYLPIVEQNYVEALLLKADQMKLHEERYWRLLLHYLPGKEGQVSEADKPDFFFSNRGRKDPRAELHASLRAFFKAPQIYAKSMHPQCKFPARFRWLQKKLAFAPQKTPQLKCPALDFWLAVINYDSSSIVFASHYLNSPASSFGHTLLKIDGRRFKGYDLLSYAVDYAAAIDDNVDPIRYAIHGLSGGFEGRFSVLPYHLKVKSYNDIENRDLWEYQLNLKKEEIDRMLLHIYELEQTYFDYYFVKENCGYHILSLLEIARPKLDLRSSYQWVTFPLETIKQLFVNNVISKTVYRPSNKVDIEQRIRKLNPQEKKIFYSLAKKRKTLSETDFSHLEEERKIYLLDSLLAVLRSKIEYAEKSTQNEKDKRHYEYLLKQRVKLPPSKEVFQVKQEKIAPHLSHAPSALSLLGGLSSYGAFGAMQLRPLLREILNVEDGYPANSDLLFLSTDIRWYEKEKSPKLYNLEILKLSSLVPYDSYNKPFSYSYSIRIDSEFLEREKMQNQNLENTKRNIKHSNVGEIEGLMGYSFNVSKSTGSIFALLGGGLYRYAPSRSQNKNTASPALSAVFLSGSDRWRGQILIHYYPFSIFFREQEQDETQLKLALRYGLAKNIEAFGEIGQRKNYQEASFRILMHL